MDKTIIIDFDSTFARIEVLDELAELALADNPDRERLVKSIREITCQGMEGLIPFEDSLKKRVALLQANRSHVRKLIEFTRQHVSTSVQANRDFFRQQANSIYIISGGFSEIIVPVVADFGLAETRVFANNFIFNQADEIIGVDSQNLMAQEGGKVKQVRKLALDGTVYVLGDGYTDYQIKEAGLADVFVAFVENVTRPNVIAKADYAVSSLDEFLIREGIGV